MHLIDTHCHIHDPEFFTPEMAEQTLQRAIAQGVDKLLCVATSLEDSQRAITFAEAHPETCWATVGIHPHEAGKLSPEEIVRQLDELTQLAKNPKVVAVGECGFDFYYHDKREALARQEQLLRGQLEVAQAYNLPVSFHVREAFDEFWRVFEEYPNPKGVLHSFTDKDVHLARALDHKLKIGINGIATFTTHTWQRELLQQMSLGDFILETDAPFLTPIPKRGKINEPENVIYITRFLAELRGEREEEIAKASTAAATGLFRFT